MIAIPVKTNKENPAVTTLFGKAKWFAFIDGDRVTIEKNELQSGREVVAKMAQKGVTDLIFHHMGDNPFTMLQKANIACYHDGGEPITLQNALAKFQNGELIKVDESNSQKFIEKGQHKNHDHHH